MNGQKTWRCAAVVRESRNADRVKIVCRDEAELQMVKEAAQKTAVEGSRVMRDQLYPVRVDNANRTAILDAEGNVLPGAIEALSAENRKDFNIFLGEFNSMYEAAGYQPSMQKQTLWDSLPAPVNQAVVERVYDTKVRYEDFCESAQHQVFVARHNFSEAQKKRNHSSSSGSRGVRNNGGNRNNARGRHREQTDNEGASREAGGNRISEEERERRRINNLCYRCGESGHIAPFCRTRNNNTRKGSHEDRGEQAAPVSAATTNTATGKGKVCDPDSSSSESENE
ncbi:hypothetical protein HIM_10804 [Hirsutella minnesotensis 3608]|uniref:CCHC-type domain-containing protein n=1 Tax=Hirsutella minnesotensis 3608 TaxID=1043627 RepID=A0A0F7ZJP2_9HYPO|nr:hypothetical protein HIM_10804 [Hirsutella minnesotensis 3608]